MDLTNTKVVILAGGKGTRLKEKTEEMPKPLLMVGLVPIIQHIINRYLFAGFREFVIPVGYLGEKVKQYFRSAYVPSHEHENDLWVTSLSGDVKIHIKDTGLDTQTGGRLWYLKDELTEPFMMTYGDGLSNVNPKFIFEYAQEVNKNVVTAVHPVPRFGSMVVAPTGEVQSFSEKVINSHDWINGGFFYLKPDVFDYITGSECNFEKDVLPKIVWASGLYAFQYEGVWQCIDTLRDLELANELHKTGVLK